MDVKHSQKSSPEEGLVPGRKPVHEYVKQHPERIEQVLVQKDKSTKELAPLLYQCRQRSVRYVLVPRNKLDALYPGNHQGVIARVFMSGFTDVKEFLQSVGDAPLRMALALDQVQDPHNVGALARTLFAMGGAGILVTKHNSAALGAGAVKSSAGTLLDLPVARCVNLSQTLETAKEMGLFVYGLARGEGASDLFDADPAFPAVFVLGNEEKGLRPGVAKACDAIYEIPFARKADSLNVAQTGALVVGRVHAITRTSKG